MSRAAFRSAIRTLPYRLREQLDGYVQTVEEHASEIFQAAGVPATPDLRNQLVFIAGIRRLWEMVDGQYQMLHDTLDTLGNQEVASLRIGGSVYGIGTADYQRVAALRQQLLQRLQQLGVVEYVNVNNLSDIPPMLAEN